MSLGMRVNEGTPTMSFVLYTINVECMIVRCKLCNMKVQTIQNIPCNFREKIQNSAKCKYIYMYWGPDSIVVAPYFFEGNVTSHDYLAVIFESFYSLFLAVTSSYF